MGSQYDDNYTRRTWASKSYGGSNGRRSAGYGASDRWKELLGAVDPAFKIAFIDECLRLGAIASFKRSRDGGALGLTIYSENLPRTKWVAREDELYLLQDWAYQELDALLPEGEDGVELPSSYLEQTVAPEGATELPF